jgi:glycosyltransferase involved in cell wall biosynthesis
MLRQPKPETMSGSADALRWLEEFRAARGRPLRVLHVGNIANNAYNNAKIQRAHGIEAHVIAANYYHVMGCPEWEDAEIEGEIADPFFPDFWSVDLNGFERPRWFAQGPLDECRRYLWYLNRGRARTALVLWRYLQFHRLQVVKPWLGRHGKRVKLVTAARRFAQWREKQTAGGLDRQYTELTATAEAAVARAGGLTGAALRDKLGIAPDDFVPFYAAALAWLPLFLEYDIVVAYSTDPIWPLLCQLNRFAAYEHGTIREIPFQDDVMGRLTNISYRHAPAVFITNSDNIAAADRLGIGRESRSHLPHAFDYRKLLAHAQASRATRPPIPQVFMPSRQDWRVRDPAWAKGNDVLIRALARLKMRGVPFHAKFVAWGKDLDASRSLIAELGLTGDVTWTPLLNKKDLWDEYLRSTVVADQFVVAGVSGVSFEALALGVPVVTRADKDAAQRFFGVAPPVLPASTEAEAARALRSMLTDETSRRERARRSAEWIARHHSPARIMELEAAVFERLMQLPHAFNSPINPLAT